MKENKKFDVVQQDMFIVRHKKIKSYSVKSVNFNKDELTVKYRMFCDVKVQDIVDFDERIIEIISIDSYGNTYDNFEFLFKVAMEDYKMNFNYDRNSDLTLDVTYKILFSTLESQKSKDNE